MLINKFFFFSKGVFYKFFVKKKKKKKLKKKKHSFLSFKKLIKKINYNQNDKFIKNQIKK
jgi:hypothetical protein